MGIPSYFSYIIHNHAGVLCKYVNLFQQQLRFARLYMDCNSILYDSYRTIPDVSSKTLYELETEILAQTCIQIEHYITQIRPTETVYIAFDGVAPVAKMEQQRNRRYKSWFETAVIQQIEGKDNSLFDPTKTSCMFTPGTPFMNRLSSHMKQHFKGQEKRLCVKELIIATPDEPGEGEHKLYAHMRIKPTEEPCAIYGLDADLMMLSMFHLTYCPKIYIFREAPQFAQKLLKQQDIDVKHTEKDEPLFLDMGKMARSIANEMRCSAPDNHRMYDYVFMCFFLGNDFLPHFPAMNIRTGGIDALMDTYRAIIGNVPERFLLSKSNPPKIVWKEVHRFVQELAKHEYNWICQEYATRKKWDAKPAMMQPKKTVKERMELFQNTPVLYRKEEKYIDPHQAGWETRYYETLFPGAAKPPQSNEFRRELSINYLEGLEWVSQYYLYGQVDWQWKYKYHYPPLLRDLALMVPTRSTTFLSINTPTVPVPPFVQLAYVLPPIYHHLLPESMKTDTSLQSYYKGTPLNENGLPDLEFQWAFCRHFWECHVYLPEISLAHLTELYHRNIC